jgi:adenine-specific DNA-methyltransferase
MLKINNRRYIGSKTKLVDVIYAETLKRIDGKFKFADIFAGTGVVAYEFASKGYPVIVNDILYSNYVSYKAWFSNEKVNFDKLNNILDKFNSLSYDNIEENYFSRIYGDKYYSVNDAKKIGFIREEIEKNKNNLNEREYYALITSLMYAADRIANTVGHFEHFLKQKPSDFHFELASLSLEHLNDCEVFQKDANELVRKIKADVIYIDPPYNARQYVNFYHVLENLATWEKPTEFEGTSMKFKRDHLKSGYSRVVAKQLMEDLIENIDARLIIVSYNNTYNAKSTASNNRIKEKDIIKMLKNKGKLEIIELDHQFFNSGKTKFVNHKEKLYICEVKQSE